MERLVIVRWEREKIFVEGLEAANKISSEKKKVGEQASFSKVVDSRQEECEQEGCEFCYRKQPPLQARWFQERAEGWESESAAATRDKLADATMESARRN
jgi:hypothetical protein